jgi:uncharacterized protein (TIGR00730 family)
LAAIQRLCVFCGSSPGLDPRFREAAQRLGSRLAHEGIELVYGGGRVGLMGMLADAVLAAGGRAIGVIPSALATKEVAHDGLSSLEVVPSMHERKARMAELADAFVALPGGLGTLEELFEIATWSQLGFHAKPLALLNVAGYYDPLLLFLDHAVGSGFLRPEHRHILRVATDAGAVLSVLEAGPPVVSEKWIRKGET